MVAAIVLARAGSKRIPGKNIRSFAGRPVIEYSIEAARAAEIFDRIIVSTDSNAIAEVATLAGAEVPFKRPKEHADDHATSADAVLHAIRWLNENDREVRFACAVYATAPLVSAESLRQGLRLLQESRVATVVPVTTFAFPIQRAMEQDERGHLRMLWPEHETTRSNDLPETYHDAGQFYWLDAAAFLKSPRLYGKPMAPLVLPRHRVQDLDTLEDWEYAERLFELDRLSRSK